MISLIMEARHGLRWAQTWTCFFLTWECGLLFAASPLTLCPNSWCVSYCTAKITCFFFVVVVFLIHVVSTIYVLFPFIFYLYLGKIGSSHFEQKVVSFFDTLLIAIITRTNSNKEGEVFVFFPYNGKNKNNIFHVCCVLSM